MYEFNSDGSIKLPDKFVQKKKDDEQKLINQRCIKIRKEVVSFVAPKKCVLKITLSDKFDDNRFIDTIYGYFRNRASVPSSLRKIDDKNFEVEIGTDFKRCTDCCSLIKEFREFLYGNIIEEKGSCTFEGFKRNFSYEDYFDWKDLYNSYLS